jgi:hypothetical protein
MEKAKQRGERKGQAVEKQPDGLAERQAARVAGREPLDARTKEPMDDPDQGRLEQPDLGHVADNKNRKELADGGEMEPHDHGS